MHPHHRPHGRRRPNYEEEEVEEDNTGGGAKCIGGESGRAKGASNELDSNKENNSNSELGPEATPAKEAATEDGVTPTRYNLASGFRHGSEFMFLSGLID